jgi:hypothetical protein
MKLLALPVLALSGFALSGEMAMANPMADVCRARAVDASGYRGLTRTVGNVQFGLSGSVAMGAAGQTDRKARRRRPMQGRVKLTGKRTRQETDTRPFTTIAWHLR